MKIDLQTGVVEFTPDLILRPGMMRNELLALNVNWEEWDIIKKIPFSFRTIFKMPNKGMSPKTILVVYIGVGSEPIQFWGLVPWDRAGGSEQNRPEGKHTKKMRAWFREMSDIGLPIRKEWGHVDASYDPWNQSAGVVCNYRERFGSEEEWKHYKKDNKY
jgi:hypothetical protein